MRCYEIEKEMYWRAAELIETRYCVGLGKVYDCNELLVMLYY